MTGEAPELFQAGANCWHVETAARVSIIVDADAYFSAARAAMLKAQRRIMIVGWDFDARVDLDRTADDVEGPRDLGHFLPWLVERTPALEVFLLRWDTGTIKSILSHGTIRATIRWIWSPRIHIRLDGHHPATASHHQKILIVDDELAFCGGIDMLADRWDTRAHEDDDPRRAVPGKSPFKPWHDATAALSGAAAHRLAELCRDRWQRSGASPLAPVEHDRVRDCWPTDLPVDFRDIAVAISRTIPTMDDQEHEHEIEQLTLHLIASAKRYIYAESQYFASRKICRAIAKRLEEPDGPEIVIVNPLSAQGLLEPIAMDSARARLVQALRACDYEHRFRLYHAYTLEGAPIYTHAKILVIDDIFFKIGSSNMNNRSMQLDTECDITLDARHRAEDRARILALRDGLLAEHLGIPVAEFRRELDESGSLVAAVEALRQRGGKTLRPYEVPDLSAVETWLADNEILDPEGPDELIEPPKEHRLFRARTSLLNRLLRR